MRLREICFAVPSLIQNTHLLFLEKCANFPIINANFHIRANRRRLFQPFYIAEMDGMKILFIGIITEDILAQTKADELIGSFVDIGEAALEVGNICNAYNGIDIGFTVLLTHIGFEEDKKLAALLDPAWGVDVIIGGHSHSFLAEPALVNGIYIVQAGTGTDQIGRFDIMVDTDLNAIDSFTWQLVPINNETCGKDEEMEQFINQYRVETDKKYDRIVTRFTNCLTHPARNQETALGNLIADILCDSLRVDLMLMGSGAIRSYGLGPVVHYQDLVECLPYDETVYMLRVNGTQIERMLLDGKALDKQKLYTIALSKFHYMNMQNFLDISLEELKPNAPPRVLATSYRDIIEEYMMMNPHLFREVEGRLVVKE